MRAWRGGGPVFFGDPETLDAEFPHLAAIRADTGTGSCLAAPLITAGKVTGVLAVTWPEPRFSVACEIAQPWEGLARILRAGAPVMDARPRGMQHELTQRL